MGSLHQDVTQISSIWPKSEHQDDKQASWCDTTEEQQLHTEEMSSVSEFVRFSQPSCSHVPWCFFRISSSPASPMTHKDRNDKSDHQERSCSLILALSRSTWVSLKDSTWVPFQKRRTPLQS